MMKTSELRLGNITNYGIVSVISEEHIELVGVDKAIHIHNVEPVQLTEENLLELGFEKHTEQSFSVEIHNGWKIIWETSGYIYLKYLETECEVSHHEYRYVHQVQNLVYHLTGEELTPITK